MIEENIKNRLLLALSILTVISLMWSVGSCGLAARLRKARDKEMLSRLDLEEKMNKFTQEKANLENKSNSLAQGLEEEKVAHQASSKALLQEQLVNQSLKEELQKVSKLKEALEEDLKDALVGDRATKSKR